MTIMPKKTLPRIVAVAADKKPLTLRILWNNGEVNHVDVAGLVRTFRVYEPLRRSPELFARVQVGEHGTDVVWTDEIDMAADTLWRLAQEQAGITMSPDAFKSWRERSLYARRRRTCAWIKPPHGGLLRTGHEAYSACRCACYTRA